MSNLDTYNKKRDFNKTSEPKAELKNKVNQPSKLKFVVQRHNASRLHYDCRLEIDGALKSWAVPKGPSLNPKDKRLAVQVEDHPLSYASFEGTIPKGNYGAGTVVIFDEGYYTFLECKNEMEFLDQWEKGSIKFKLEGKTLKGDFALVRMKADDPKNWLLIKHKDEFSVSNSYNAEDFVRSEETAPIPMFAKLSNNIPDDSDWIYEKKFDGFRAIAVVNDENSKLLSRNSKSLAEKFPSLLNDLKTIKHHVILDGEIVIEDKKGISQFQLLQKGEPISKNFQLTYYVFDILNLDKDDTKNLPLVERKELLKLLLNKYKLKQVIYVENLGQDQKSVLEYAEQNKWEGIIAKLKDSHYQEGKRNGNWLKIKLKNTQEAIICGYTSPAGSRSFFGALVLGAMRDRKLIYIGNCGTGFNDATLKMLFDKMHKLKRKKKVFDSKDKVAKESEVTWITPKLICDVHYSEWTNDEHLRHPVFKGLRTDKIIDDVKIEMPEAEIMEKERKIKVGKKEVNLTNLNKIYWPKEKITKGDMLYYYEEVADYILPYLKDKPISMHRFPNGIEAESFFQKDVDPEKIPDWLQTSEVYSKSTDKTIDYLLCNDLPSLLYIANLGSIEINSWLSTYKKPDKPEFAVLDLDPNGARWEDLIDVALTAKEILDKAKVPCFVKTSGSTGLHILINVAAKYDYEIVRDFIQFIGELINQNHPETTSLIRDPKKRKGLIYLDYLQNKQGQTIASAYSVRPKSMATVSTPLDWQEVNYSLKMTDFTIYNTLERISKIEDPWKDIWKSKIDIKAALANF